LSAYGNILQTFLDDCFIIYNTIISFSLQILFLLTELIFSINNIYYTKLFTFFLQRLLSNNCNTTLQLHHDIRFKLECHKLQKKKNFCKLFVRMNQSFSQEKGPQSIVYVIDMVTNPIEMTSQQEQTLKNLLNYNNETNSVICIWFTFLSIPFISQWRHPYFKISLTSFFTLKTYLLLMTSFMYHFHGGCFKM
jgi:hypothetical protein